MEKLTTESFGLAWPGSGLVGISCGTESACLSYVAVSAVSISKRCTVYILNKSQPLLLSRCWCCRTMEHGPGVGAWRCRSFCPSTLARHPCQAPVPDNFYQFDAQSARAIGVRKQPSVLRRPTFSHALKLPGISRRETQKSCQTLPPSPSLYP